MTTDPTPPPITSPSFADLSHLDATLPAAPWAFVRNPDSWCAGNTIVDADGQVLLEGDSDWESYLSHLPDHDIPLLLAQLRNGLPALLGRISALQVQLAQAQAQAAEAQEQLTQAQEQLSQAWDEGYQKHIERTGAVDAGGVLPDTTNPYMKKESSRG